AALPLLESARADLRGWEWRYVHRLCHADLVTLTGHTDRVTSAAFDPTGSRIVTGSEDGTAKVWDPATGAAVLTFKGHAGGVTAVAFSRDGSRLVTGSRDRTARVWDGEAG